MVASVGALAEKARRGGDGHEQSGRLELAELTGFGWQKLDGVVDGGTSPLVVSSAMRLRSIIGM